MAGKNVTAFVLDEERVSAPPDGVTITGLPGLWKPGVAYHPDALGLTLADMRELIESLNAPLVEEKVPEGKAMGGFDLPANHLLSAPNVIHPAAAGPGFGDVDIAAAPDAEGALQQAELLETAEEEGVTPSEADEILREEGRR